MIEHTPRRDRAYARNFLQTLDPLQAVMGELLTPAPWASPDDQTGNPLVLTSRYRDNIYLSLCNIPPHVRTQVLHALQVMLRQIYGIPLKWEPQTDRVVWGEAQAWSAGIVTTKPTPDTVHSPTPGQLRVESIQLAFTFALCCCYALCMKSEELLIFYSFWLRCFVVLPQYVGFWGRSQLFGSQVKVGAPTWRTNS